MVLSEIIPGMPRQLEFVKLRASFADVGTPFERWLANPVHEWPDKGNAWATDTTYPVELKPERTQSWEVGLQARFLTWFSLDATYYRTNTKNQTFFPYQASNVRLQEASIGYTFPRKMLGDVCELTLQLVGRNLWMIYNKAPFDPESIATTGNYYQGIDYFMMPATRNFGFNVRIKF